MSLTGTNKLCSQCIRECKQWSQVRIINCPFFESRQQKTVKVKEGGTLQAEQNRKEAPGEAIFEKEG